MKYLLPLLLLTGCAAPRLVQERPPMLPGQVMLTKGMTAPQPSVIVPGDKQGFGISWNYWADGVKFSQLYAPLKIVLDYTVNLKTWTRLATLPPTATNLTVNITRVPFGAFRIGYTGL